MLYAQSTSAGSQKVPWDTVTRIINGSKEDFPWLHRNIINSAYKKYLEKINKQDALSTTSASPTTLSSGGRPKGQTNLLKCHRKETILAVKNEITELFKMKKKKERKLSKNFLEDGSNRALKMYVRREVSVGMYHISI